MGIRGNVVTDVPENASRQFLDMMRAMEFLPNGRLVDLEPCEDAIAVLVWSFNNHRDAVRHIDLTSLSDEESALFYSRFTQRMNEALMHLDGLDRGDLVTVRGNTIALVSRSGGEDYYPQVLSDTAYVSGTLERLVVAQVPDQAGMDLIRLEIDNIGGEEVIVDNMTHDYAGLAMIIRGAKMFSDDPDVTQITDGALVLVPIHHDDVIVHRVKRPNS